MSEAEAAGGGQGLTKAEACCRAKDAYPGRGEAKFAAKVIRKKRGRVLFHYFCDVCRKWHLTSKRRSKAMAEKDRLREVAWKEAEAKAKGAVPP